MDLYGIRSLLKTKSIYDMPLRVVYYARVSSEKDEQLNSLSNQQFYYDGFIKGNKNWIFSGEYVDEGISGITTNKRENFHRMVDDAKEGKFDLIVTKEITRFARNTLDSIMYTRKLLSDGVGVFFQNDNINTLEEDAELRLTIMSGIAQDESRKLSSRIKFGHSQAIKRGIVMGNSLIYGYEKNKGKLIINEKQAEMVRLVYNLYATGNHSTCSIEKILKEKGYRNTKGGYINRNVLRKIIPNPKYKGYYCGNKVKIIDMFTKKQLFLDEDEWIQYKDEEIVPAIIDAETWEKANQIFEVRSQDIKSRRVSYKTKNLFTGKITCAEHNAPFYLKARIDRNGNNNSTWVCSHRIKNGHESCYTFGVKETELSEILFDVLKEIASNLDNIIEKYVDCVKEACRNTSHHKEITRLEAQINVINEKKEKILELSLEEHITNNEFGIKNKAYNDEINILLQKIAELKNIENGQNEVIKDIFKLKRELLAIERQKITEFTPGIIDNILEKILVSGNEEGNILDLKIFLKTGEVAKRKMCRYGSTIKKMIEAQEKAMAQGGTSAMK